METGVAKGLDNRCRVLWLDPGGGGGQIPGLAVTHARTLFDAALGLASEELDAAVLIVGAGGGDLAPWFDVLRDSSAEMPLIVFAPSATMSDAVGWTKLGADQVVVEERALPEAVAAAARAAQLRNLANFAAAASGPAPWRKLLIGRSRKIHQIADVIRLVAPRRCTVLVTGETGTGKEVVARCIHNASGRSAFELVAVNCSALPENLLEAELFGHVKGAFTGATAQRMGRFEQANRGSLFLDEIGDLPMPLQAKLLRVLQEREFQRLGSSETIKADVRVIAATNVNLTEKVKQGQFREDLYYRLNVVPIEVPPLRERPGDIPLLVRHFLERICREEDLPVKQASDEVMSRLTQHDWPGNVRQLENAVEMAIVLSGDRRMLYPSDFPLPRRSRPAMASAPSFVSVPDQGLDFERTVGGIELNILEQALRKTGGNKKLAADMLRLKRTTLAAKLKSLSETMGAAS